jgi:hypothetical protein
LIVDVSLVGREALRRNVENPLLIRGVPAERRVWIIRVHDILDIRGDGARDDLREQEAGNGGGGADRVAIGIAHAEFGRDGAALIEHASAVGIDRLQNLMAGIAVARTSDGLILHGLIERGRGARGKVRIAGIRSSD